MTKTDWAVAGLNGLMVIVAVLGLLGPRGGVYEGPAIALLLAVVTAMVNGAWIIRQGSRASAPERVAPRAEEAPLPLDARQLLEIDERLAALEREDARRIREMAARGDLHAPTEPYAPASGAGDASARVR